MTTPPSGLSVLGRISGLFFGILKDVCVEIKKKKSDALVGRVSTFHILETYELAIFSRNPPQISKIYKPENHTLKDLL
jgi:hypothetical protein